MDAQEHAVCDFLAFLFWLLAFLGQIWVLSGGAALSVIWILAQPWGVRAVGWWGGGGVPGRCGREAESSLRSIYGLNQLCLLKNLPILDWSVEAIREITGPFLIPDSVQCLFRKIENSPLEQGIIWAHTESCCLSSMPADNLPFSEV